MAVLRTVKSDLALSTTTPHTVVWLHRANFYMALSKTLKFNLAKSKMLCNPLQYLFSTWLFQGRCILSCWCRQHHEVRHRCTYTKQQISKWARAKNGPKINNPNSKRLNPENYPSSKRHQAQKIILTQNGSIQKIILVQNGIKHKTNPRSKQPKLSNIFNRNFEFL